MLRWLFPWKQRMLEPRRANWLVSTTTRLLASGSLIVGLVSCGSGTNSAAIPVTTPSDSSNVLTREDVINIVSATAAAVNVPMVVAVTDRRGVVLAVFRKNGYSATTLANFQQVAPSDEVAVALARTASFFSNDQAPIGSRTVRFISGIHFPPGVLNTESAPLYGIENTNRGCSFNTSYLPGQSLPPSTLIHSNSPGLGILTGKANILDSDPNAVNPGGVPSSRTTASPEASAWSPTHPFRITTGSSSTPRSPERS